jgi:hypothetical protein
MTPKEVHALVMAFPEVTEGTSYGYPSYKAFGKFFTRLRSQDASMVVGCVPIDERELLCELDPDTFHFTAHYKDYPYVLVRIASVEPDQLKSFLTRAWRKNAPKRWLKDYDKAQGA